MRTRADYRAALYMRLSKDDDGAAESASITTQRQLLRSYAAEHGYAVQDEYSDAAVIIGLKTLRLKKSQKHAAF